MIVIPDVHGRDFWKEAVKQAKEGEKIIFLGDYTDPYSWEGISKEECFNSLNEIIDFKFEHKDDVILLIGNHDLSYVDQRMIKCRHDSERHDYIKEILLENIDLFDLAYEVTIEDVRYIFSHSGILPKWIRFHEDIEETEHMSMDNVVDFINDKFHNDFDNMIDWLSDISRNRGGYGRPVGSCVWGDVYEFWNYVNFKSENEQISDSFQIFGHTQQREDPIINEDFACLDCRRGFRFNENNGKIEELGTDD